MALHKVSACRDWTSDSTVEQTFRDITEVSVSHDLLPWPWPWADRGCGLYWGPSCASLVAIQPFRTVFEILSFKGIGVATLAFRVTWRHRSYVTTGFSTCGFLLVVNMNRQFVFHSCRDVELQRYLGHDLDLLGSRDVICHVTIGFAIWGFLLLFN